MNHSIWPMTYGFKQVSFYDYIEMLNFSWKDIFHRNGWDALDHYNFKNELRNNPELRSVQGQVFQKCIGTGDKSGFQIRKIKTKRRRAELQRYTDNQDLNSYWLCMGNSCQKYCQKPYALTSLEGSIVSRVDCYLDPSTGKYLWSRRDFSTCEKCEHLDVGNLSENVDARCLDDRLVSWRQRCSISCSNGGYLFVNGSQRKLTIRPSNKLHLRCKCSDETCSSLSWQTSRYGRRNETNIIHEDGISCSAV